MVKILDLDPQVNKGLSVFSLHILPMHAWVPQLSSAVQDMQVRLACASKLTTCMNSCLSHCFIPAIEWRLVYDVASLLPYDTRDRPQFPCNLEL